jgi:pyridoxal phosphate enzyme (YggS family)
MSDIAENFDAVLKKIRKAERAAGREEGAVKLVAASKMQGEDALRAALACGHRLFGENRVQEAQAHWAHLRESFPDLKLHLIGPLQTNKAADAVALFDCIETVDREKLADALAAEMKKQGRRVPCLIQVNTGEEEQKAGISPEALPALLSYCRECGLEIAGLMCIPPVGAAPALHFALLKKLAVENGLEHLSMGMSADFEKAVALGATYVRVGTALFGERA